MKRILCGVMLIMLCGLLLPSVQGEVYKWVDADGQVHFSDVKPDSSTNAETMDIPLVNSVPGVATQDKPEQAQATKASSKKVVIYTTEWCGYCKKAIAFFRAKGIPYQEYDVEKSARGKRDYAAMNGRSVPIIIVGDKRMSGFTASRFMQLYND